MSASDNTTSGVGLRERPATNSVNPTIGQQLTAWLDEAFAQLRESSWREVVVQSDHDVLEAARADAYVKGLGLLRDGKSPHVAGSFPEEIQKRVRATASALRARLDDRQWGRYSTAAEKGGVFFWPREPTHVKTLLPVAAAVERQGQAARFVACQPKVFQHLRRLGQPAMYLPALWPEDAAASRNLAAQQVKLIKQLPRVKLDESRLPRLAESDELLSLLRWLVIKNEPWLQASVAHCRNIIERLQAAVVVVGNDVTIEGRAACQVAAARGVPTACAMHGIIAGHVLHAYHSADRYLVYGERDRRELSSMGVSADRLRVCGAPYLDDVPRQSGKIDPTIAARLGLDDARPYVLVATSGPGDSISHAHHRLHIETIAKASRDLPNAQFVAKLHRKDSPANYAELAKTVPDSRLRIIPHGTSGVPENIFNWLQGAGLLLTGASAVSLEAMLLSVPVITMDFLGELARIDFIEQQATSHVADPQTLVPAIERLLGSDEAVASARRNAQAYLHDVFLAVDGRSGDRVATEILALIGQPANARS